MVRHVVEPFMRASIFVFSSSWHLSSKEIAICFWFDNNILIASFKCTSLMRKVMHDNLILKLMFLSIEHIYNAYDLIKLWRLLLVAWLLFARSTTTYFLLRTNQSRQYASSSAFMSVQNFRHLLRCFLADSLWWFTWHSTDRHHLWIRSRPCS